MYEDQEFWKYTVIGLRKRELTKYFEEKGESILDLNEIGLNSTSPVRLAEILSEKHKLRSISKNKIVSPDYRQERIYYRPPACEWTRLLFEIRDCGRKCIGVEIIFKLAKGGFFEDIYADTKYQWENKLIRLGLIDSKRKLQPVLSHLGSKETQQLWEELKKWKYYMPLYIR